MKRFRLNMAALAAGILISAVFSGWSFAVGEWALAILLMIGCGGLIACLFSLVGQLKQTISTFVTALDMNDHTIRFDIGSDDPTLRKMSSDMNRLITIYNHNLLELETRKLYYDRILRIMTHEMRNSITPVIALTTDYTTHPEKYGPADLEETMTVIRDQSMGIKKFLDSYYNLTHLPEPTIKNVKALEFMARIRKLAAIEEKERRLADVCRFTVSKDLDLSIDPDLITHALINLIRNALDAVKETAFPKVEIIVSRSGNQPCISVSDNGPGMPENVKANLFQPFVTTKPGGSGIGLTLSRQIARCHNGNLTISSGPRGTTATITLS